MTNVSNATAVVSGTIRFAVGEKEIALANAARNATASADMAFRDLYELVVVDHELPISALMPRAKDAPKRSNEEQAAYDFAINIFYTYKFGSAIAMQLDDKNVKPETILPISQFIGATGIPYTDQAKRAIKQSFGGKPWKDFVEKFAAIHTADAKLAEIEAKLDAGEITQADADAAAAAVDSKKRGKASTKTRQEKVVAMVTELCKMLRKDAGDNDGAFDYEKAKAFAAIVSKAASDNGFR